MPNAQGVGSHPLLTIITVTRNDRAGLKRTRESITEQSGVNADTVEWFIVDGSDDAAEARSMQADAAGKITTRVMWQEPQGIYAAMNAGLEQARGTFVLFLNAGDVLADDHVIHLLSGVLCAANPPNWVVGRVRIIDRAGNAVDSAVWDFQEEKKHLFARGVFPPHQATVVSTQALRDIGGFDRRFAIAADYHAALKLARISDPFMLDEVVAVFSEGGVSTTQWKRAAAEFHRARREVFAPSVAARVREAWHTAKNWTALFLYRDVLRRGQ